MNTDITTAIHNDEQSSSTSTTPTSVPTKIFLVEDDVFIGSILTEKIQDAHINVTRYISAEEAIKALETEIPDIMILDIYLPGIDGLTALGMIRKNEKTKDILVVVLSNTDEKKDRDAAAALGAKFLVKAANNPRQVLDFVLAEFKATRK